MMPIAQYRHIIYAAFAHAKPVCSGHLTVAAAPSQGTRRKDGYWRGSTATKSHPSARLLDSVGMLVRERVSGGRPADGEAEARLPQHVRGHVPVVSHGSNTALLGPGRTPELAFLPATLPSPQSYDGRGTSRTEEETKRRRAHSPR